MVLRYNFALLVLCLFATSSDVVSALPLKRSGSVVYESGDVRLAQRATTDSACVSEVTVTVTVSGTAVSTPTDAVTVQVGNGATNTAAAPAATSISVGAADFGSCSTPQIEFGAGFDGRKETSFQPVDKTSFNHGSADNIDIIAQFICDTLTNSCKANQAAKDLCAQAESAADAASAKTGAQADAFNGVFGIQTNFASVGVIDDQGNVVSSGTNSAVAPASTAAATTSVTTAAAATATAASVAADSGIGDFGKCSTPQIKFGVGFDNRKETSFEPADQTSFNHGSADDIDIITQFICDTLTNSCGADATAKATCAKAQAAADTATKGTGAQADAFNAVFDFRTDFAAVQEIDNQGRPVGAAATGSQAAAGSNAAAATTPSVNNVATNTNSNDNTGSTSSNDTSSSPSSGGTASDAGSAGNLQTFTGALGGITAPPVTATGDGKFQVTGNSVFNDQKSAIQRSCDVQHNNCANAANASENKNGFTVAACNAQQTQCSARA